MQWEFSCRDAFFSSNIALSFASFFGIAPEMQEMRLNKWQTAGWRLAFLVELTKILILNLHIFVFWMVNALMVIIYYCVRPQNAAQKDVKCK